jgi:hypothetical protein
MYGNSAKWIGRNDAKRKQEARKEVKAVESGCFLVFRTKISVH